MRTIKYTNQVSLVFPSRSANESFARSAAAAFAAQLDPTLDELGDIIEVLEELAHLQGWTDWEIRHARSEKAQRNGIFRERIFLEKVLED